MIETNVLDKGSALLTRWQADDDALEELHTLFDAVIAGQFDAVLREQVPADSVSVTTSIHLMTLTLLNQLYGLTSADFYKGDPRRYVRTTLMTQWLLGIRKLTLGWPVYAFGAECLGQVMMYPDKHASGSPLFISPQRFVNIAAPPVQRLISDYSWGNRVFVANYRGHHLALTAGKSRQRRTAGRRGRRE